MRTETKERVAFVAASMVKLTEMMTGNLKDVANMVGVNVIRDHLGPNPIYDLIDIDTMAEKICIFSGLEPEWPVFGRTDEELTQMGRQIADLVEDASPIDEDAAENLFAVLTWEGLGAWLAINNE